MASWNERFYVRAPVQDHRHKTFPALFVGWPLRQRFKLENTVRDYVLKYRWGLLVHRCRYPWSEIGELHTTYFSIVSYLYLHQSQSKQSKTCPNISMKVELPILLYQIAMQTLLLSGSDSCAVSFRLLRDVTSWAQSGWCELSHPAVHLFLKLFPCCLLCDKWNDKHCPTPHM